ncbi:Retrovirus-related Pol polyprotein from transposon TNT 1-94 [Cucumis melo var. makuwa]|uniref:Retrovirus-related Pol polyprotein from transposon TNT 1-94 n=1 Tax=Cucumis melo var. makuwa TaxID=1194695 RepID=A0A5A7U7K3_CUCMM|nr:Retrovirus-related Pol polyprotein from transposon TNT 1-94 [Cucumis melo var. makuwa]
MDFLRQTFQTTRKGNLNMEDYLRTMKNNIDNLGQAGSLVPPRALVSQVLLGLYEVYKPVIANIRRFSNSHQFYANNRNHFHGQRGTSNNGRGCGRGRGNKPTCQVCGQSSRASVNPSPTGICNPNFLFFEKILEHQNSQCNTRNATLNAAVNVAKREEPQTTAEDVAATEATNPLAKCVSSNPFATSETIIDLNWYIDSGATNHVMAESSSLTNSVDYSGTDKVTVGNGNTLHISCVGHSYLTDGK